MKLGIVGLPNVGKSTLFNAITNVGAQSANYPFCTIEPNIGTVDVPDERLEKLVNLYSSKREVPTSVEFVDIAGLVKGAAGGEGLGNKFLSHIRQVDAIVHVVRCFEDSNIVHVEGSVDPIRDIEIINLELILSDIEMIERRLSKSSKMAKTDKAYKHEVDILEKLKLHLEDGKTAKSFDGLEDDEVLAIVESFDLLTSKPVIYVSNMDEDSIMAPPTQNNLYNIVKEYSQKEGSSIVHICAKIEEEISSLESDEKSTFLKELGIGESGLTSLIKSCYSLLGLISFLTAGVQEVRAWTIKNNTKAPQAAGKIHSDMERGFIRAEVVSYNDLIDCGGLTPAKEKGLVRSEGKDYIVRDGDVILFRFNV